MNVYNAVCFLYNTQALRKLNRSRGRVKDHRWAPWLPQAAKYGCFTGTISLEFFTGHCLCGATSWVICYSPALLHTHTQTGAVKDTADDYGKPDGKRAGNQKTAVSRNCIWEAKSHCKHSPASQATLFQLWHTLIPLLINSTVGVYYSVSRRGWLSSEEEK